MLAVKVAFSFYFLFGVFEETVSWTIDLPQVRKYFFEKSLKDKPDDQVERIVYDNINNYSPHFDYEKYREHYADEYEYDGYMEQKVHDAVRNGSAYLEGLRRAIENYTRKLETCRRMNFSVNIFELQPNILNLTNPTFTLTNTTNFNPSNFTIDLPTNFTQNFPANFTRTMNTNFTNFMRMSGNSTVFNTNATLRECMRADRASEHVRRLAQLAIWAATELQDKLYADKYEKHADHDGTLILKLAWFLDRLAHLTGYDPQPHQFVEPKKSLQPTPTPAMQSLVPGMISNEDLQYLLTCMKRDSSQVAPERCAFPPRQVSRENPVNFMNRNYPGSPPYPFDLIPSGSENHEYTYTEQDYAEENMPLPLPPKPVTAVKTKRKRSVQEDPLQDLFKYLIKYKAWIGSNREIKASEEIKENSLLSNSRVKRFIVKKKSKHLKPENPFPNLSSLVKHKIGVHYNKDKKEEKKLKDFFEKLNVKRPSKGKLKLFKKSKRSIGYMKKYQPRVPVNPQGDISYYVKNKKGTNYDYNAAQALLVRAGLDQVFQTGNIEVVRRYGSNYNPAVVDQTVVGVMRGLLDV